MTSLAHSAIGRALPRREDPALLTGQGRYVADIALDRPLHLAFLRSPVATGRIATLDVAQARSAPAAQKSKMSSRNDPRRFFFS